MRDPLCVAQKEEKKNLFLSVDGDNIGNGHPKNTLKYAKTLRVRENG